MRKILESFTLFCVLEFPLVGREALHDDQSYYIDVLKTLQVPFNLDGTQETTYVSIQNPLMMNLVLMCRVTLSQMALRDRNVNDNLDMIHSRSQLLKRKDNGRAITRLTEIYKRESK